ncbi:MAG: tetratricopeptide repeat protein [Flavobacteriales bacterium]|nr:tetratricopeptide repeat protein [Flavobacteriales bacterium]
MEEHFDHSFEDNNQDRIVKLEDMFSDNAYYYFDVSEWEGMIEHYLAGLKLDKASRALQFAKHQHPSSLELMMKEAELFIEKSDFKKALVLLKKLEISHPFEADIPFLIANTYSRIGRSIKSIEYYKKSLTLTEPEDSEDTYFQMASEYLLLEKPHQAIYWLKKLLDINPENIEALYEISLTYETNDLIDEAIAFFKSFIENSPYSHHAWFNLGNLYTVKEQLKEALDAYEYSILSFEEFSSGWYNKGTILAKLNRNKLALEAFFKTLELEGPSSPTYCSIAEVYENMDNFEGAFEYYKKTYELDDSYTDAWIGAANASLEKGELKVALALIEKAIKQEEDNAQAHHIYAEICQSLQFFEEAKKAYKKVIQLDSDNWEVFLDYSAILFDQEEKENAIFIIESGMVLTGNQVELGFRAGAYHYLIGNSNQAFQLWNDALAHKPADVDQIFEFDQDLRCVPEIIDFIEQFDNEL